eukprot:SAG22_NODE_4_length_44774_cov_362.122149_33_plen_77_part_00
MQAQKNLGDSGLQDSIYNHLRRKHVSDGQSVQWNPYDKLQTKLPLRNVMVDLENYSFINADPDDLVRYTTDWDFPP